MTIESESKENTIPKKSKFWKLLLALMPKKPMGIEARTYLDAHPFMRDRFSPQERLASIRAEMRYSGTLRGYF